MIKWADDDPRNSIYYHDLNNCGTELQDYEPFVIPVYSAGRIVQNKYLILSYCPAHEIYTCHCGFELGFHFGTYNRTLPPLLGNSKIESDENLNTRTQIGLPGTG